MADTQYLSLDEIAPASTPKGYVPLGEATGPVKQDRSYIGAAAESGVRSLAAAGARLIDSLNPFTLSEEDAATLYKNNPDKLKEITEHSASMALSRYAQEQTARARQVMGNVSPNEKGAISGKPLTELEYATLDPEKAAYLSPTRVAGDVLQSLPSSLALAVSGYLTKGASTRAAAQAEAEALAKGLSQAEAKAAAHEAAITTGADVMAKTGAAGEGAIGYAQQMNQAIDDAQSIKPEVLEQSPAYKELLDQGYSPEAARQKLIAQTGRESGLIAGAVDAATNLVGGHYLGKIIGEGGGLAARTARGFGTEAATETLQSGGEQLGQNYAVQQNLNPNQDLMQGVGESMVAGGVVGGVTGGGTAALFGSRQREQAEQKLGGAENAGAAIDAADQLSGSLDNILHQEMGNLTPAVNAYLGTTPTGAPVQDNSIPALRERADRIAALIEQANNAGTAFDRRNALDQAETTLGEPRARTADQFADLTPMDPLQAKQRLAVMRDMAANEGGNALGLAIVPHPSQPGKLAIGRQESPSLDLDTNQTETTPEEAQHRIETAALTGKVQQAKAEDQNSRQVVIDRALRNVEERNGVASPAEAQIFHEAGLGKPYDRIDESLAPALNTNEQLTQATGIALPNEVKSTGSESQRIANLEQANNESMTEQSARAQANRAQNERQTQAQIEQTSTAPAAPAATDVIHALVTPGNQRTAEENLTIRQAEQRMDPADFSILQRAAAAPFRLTQEERLRLRELRNTTPTTSTTPAAPVAQTQQTGVNTDLMGERVRRALGLPSNGEIVQSDVKLSTNRVNPGSTVTVTDNGQTHSLNVTDGLKGLPGMTNLMRQLARIFGKRVVFFNSDTLKADGFVRNNNNHDIFINANSQMSPLAVFGHELMHLLKRDNPIAYKAVAAVVARRLDTESRAQFRKDYGSGANLEELSSDLMGNAFQDEQFLTDVFQEIANLAPAGQAQNIINRLAAAINKAIKAALNVIKNLPQGQQAFKADELVKNLEDVRAALKQALVTYAQQQKTPAMQMEAEQARAANQVNLNAGSQTQTENLGIEQSPARRGGTVEQAGDYTIRVQKDGTLGVSGDVEQIRSMLPSDVTGRAVPGGMVFTNADAPRVRAALEGRSVAYSRAGQVVEKLPMKNGKYLGAPEKFNTPGKITSLRKWLRQLADEGAAGRYWYENSSREVLQMVGGNVQEARKFVALLAIYSPQAKVGSNSTFALRAWAQYKAGQPISVKTSVMDTKAQAAMDNVDAFWSGEKTGNFFFNLLREIDPSTAGKQGATIDMWMMRAGQYHNDAPTGTQYAFMENENNRLAQELGWEPQQVQAAIWVAMKARMENAGVKKRTEATSEKKGWIRFETGGKGQKVRVIIDAQQHRDNWLKHAIRHDPSKEDTAQAKFDFADGLRRHVGQLSWEARPGRSTNVLPGVNDAPYEQQVEFQQAVQKALLDDNGIDLLAYKVGLLVDGPDILAPGVWQGEIAAGMQKLIGMAPGKGGVAAIDPAQHRALEAYAAVLGLLLRQEGVGFHRPFYNANKSAENGVNLDIGRTLTPDEAQSLWAALDARMKAAGVQDWENGAGMISSPTGMRVVNFGAIKDNKVFQRLVENAASTLNVDEIKVGAFASDGDLITNDWKENPNGENYQSRIVAAGSPDLLRWAGDVLAPRVQAVFDEFSSKYGWGDPGKIPSFDQAAARSEAGESQAQSEVTPSRQRPQFYSQLERSIADVPERLNNQPASQWKAWLTSNASKLGIKKDEIEWSGINDYLDLRGKDKLSKDDLVAFLNTNGVQINETVFGEPSEADIEALLDDEAGEGMSREDAIQSLKDEGYSTKYDRYTLPGGENYREVLITLPEANVNAAAELQQQRHKAEVLREIQAEFEAEGNTQRAAEFARKAEFTEARVAELEKLPKEKLADNYESSHWDKKNVLAHIRVNDRTDPDGNKVLFVEEVQSDWGQEGKKRGFQGSKTFTVRQDTSGVPALAGRWEVVDQDGNIEEGFQTEEDARRWANIEQKGQGVPVAPFVTKTEGWLNLALKRIAMMAVEGGYDKVAFVNGEQSADRYSLSKQVNKLEYTEGGALYAWDKNDNEVMRKKMSENEVADHIGKELADKLLASKKDKYNSRTLTGVDLEVGGEGMKTFYDKLVPQAINKLLPKLGGSKLETVSINAPDRRSIGGGATMVLDEDRRFNQPGFDVTDEMRETVGQGVALFSRQRIVGDSKRAYTPEQKAMFQNVGRTVEVPTLKERLQELRKDMGKKLAQGLADQFAPLKDLGEKVYQLARLSKGATGAFEALLQHGKLKLVDGVYDADQSGGFIQRVGVPLHGELEDFLWWVAGNRAERLSKEDREHLFTAKDIAAAKSLDTGTTDYDYVIQHGPNKGKTTRDRTIIYRDALKSFDEFNQNALDMAEQSGLIDKESRPYWEHEFYVPFYRVADESGGTMGAKVKQGLVRQEAFKRLKGGTEKLNSDLLANTLSNWGHLIDASAKNRAGLAALEAASKVGAAVEASEDTVRQMGKSLGKRGNVVSVMDEGKERFFLIDDPYTLAALTALDYSGMKGPIMDALSTFKHWLTVGVTASPPFKIRNLVRDSVQAVATAPLSYNIATNIKQGIAASNRESQTYVSALASGGLIRFGTMLEGSEAKRTRQLIKMGVKDSSILDSESKVQAMYDKYLEPAVMAYNELGNRGEEINRAALYDQLIKQGMDHGQAALMARDLMDFSLQGSWSTVRFLTQVVPFMNARIQGLYKLGRAGKEDSARFAMVLGATALASIALMAAYGDDDDWKKREDWDRNNYWWFKIGGEAFRIPKPFEIGAIATLAERGLEYFTSKEMTGKRLGKNIMTILGDNLSLNPVPQAVKPIIDIYSNKDAFTGRPIETMGMERLEPQYRFTGGTSMVARGLSTATGGALSPVQYEHLIRGYFSWLGSFVVGAADMAIRPVTNEASRPAADYWKVATGGIVSDVKSAQSRYVSQMYDQAVELEEAYGTYKMLLKEGRTQEAREYLAENREKLNQYRTVEHIKAAETRYNERIKMIERSKLDPEAKREKIQQVQQQKDKIARLVAPGLR